MKIRAYKISDSLAAVASGDPRRIAAIDCRHYLSLSRTYAALTDSEHSRWISVVMRAAAINVPTPGHEVGG